MGAVLGNAVIKAYFLNYILGFNQQQFSRKGLQSYEDRLGFNVSPTTKKRN